MTVTDSEIDISKYIDHALLDPTATPEKVAQCCIEAEQFHFAAVCVYPTAVRQASELLHGKKFKSVRLLAFLQEQPLQPSNSTKRKKQSRMVRLNWM